LRQCLSVFFPAYAFMKAENQDMLGEAFLPSLRAILRAPSDSSLQQVQFISLGLFLLELTDSNNLQLKQNIQKPISLHFTLGLRLILEILANPTSAESKAYCKLLNKLRLNKTDQI
jgi:condensin complex subunit 3